ncbi:CheR family methyltransferase [Spirosoma radiotolerans]|uniref:CheR family methyltransferase n=1 Tax=Spirosoma radiotolerans TaxID=1379870 RepID=UPI0006968DEA|nr:CheR family methyltransferase [Spirosoma radiotolerans]
MSQPDIRKQQPQTPPVPIVAIGASAGGLEAMSSLLQHLSPTTGLVFMYIQHIGPTHIGQLSDILSRLTEMPVREARNQTPIKANHLYIIPPDQLVEVIDGVLVLKSRRRPSDHLLPIDQFFGSLAERYRAASIGILLSGMANDGTLGLKAIKSAGGITFAQDESAKFQGMLKSAIHEGVVDKVLSLQDIAQEIEWFSHQKGLFQQTAMTEPEEEIPLPIEPNTDSEDLGALLKLLRKTIGIDFSHYKMATIWRRVVRRMAIYKLPTLREYTEYLRKHPAEGGLLYNDLLINVTSFFRDTETMDYLRQVLFPQLLQAKSPYEPFRLWVSACSTGEEVYSLAIMIQEVLEEQELHLPIQIFATDLSERVIAKARLGHYASSQLTGVSPKRLKRFFTKDEEGYRINKGIRDLCVFATHNVFADPPFSRIDLISCRNLLIYTDNSLQRKAIATFHYALNPTGYLLLGKAETVGSSTGLFAQVVKNHKIYLRKNNGVRSVMPMVEPPDRSRTRLAQTMTPKPGEERLPASSTIMDPFTTDQPTQLVRTKAFERASLPNVSMLTPGHPDDLDFRVDELLSQYTPASVVVNKDMEIIRFRGATSLFLEPAPGKVNFNLLKMARPELVFDLRSIISKANKTGQAVSKTGLQILVRQQTYHVAINAVPFQSQNQEQFTLVFFEEITLGVLPPTAPAQLRNRRIKQLEEELATLRDDMRSMLEEQEASREELQSANEEIISSNEELQSINEELETSKEEIQSNNEELQTINQELQISNDQLSEAYDYSDAIFGAIRETVIILDKDLRIRSANRAFYKTFKLEPEDAISRLLYELSNREWDIPALRKLLEQVINENTIVQGYELTHYFPELGEKVLRLNARKVIRLQGQAAILLAIEDITQHKQVERLLEFLQSIITHAPVSIRLFRSVRNERGNIVDFQLVPLTGEVGQWDKQSAEDLYKNSYKALYSDTEQSALFSHYIQVVETGTPLQLEVPVEQGEQPGWHLVSANRFNDGFLLVTSDITDRKNA